MSFNKILPAAFLSVVMGTACIYASYPYMLPLVESIAKATVKENVKLVEKITKKEYPVGSFEHEQKKTI